MDAEDDDHNDDDTIMSKTSGPQRDGVDDGVDDDDGDDDFESLKV